MPTNMSQDFAVAKVFGKLYSYCYRGKDIENLVCGHIYTGYEYNHKFYINELGWPFLTGHLQDFHRTKSALPVEEPDLKTMVAAVLAKLVDIEDRLDSLENDHYHYD
jgi:hypothetical protein